MQPKTIIEPFRIKSVEPISFTTAEHRQTALEEAGYNVFQLHADDVLIDLLTDSGTGAMSSAQWGALMRGDESYAGSRSFYRFRDVVQALTGMTHIIPTHQGRAAEGILFRNAVGPGQVVPNNTHFDTTRANVEVQGATATDLPMPQAREPATLHPFKGNMDVGRLRALLETQGDKVPLVMITVTNNSAGGQPVSLANLREVSQVCKQYKKPLFLDACRFAENAWFIREREEGQGHRSPRDIAEEMFRLVDGCTMSAKKDGLANMGGFLAMQDGELAERCRNMLILTEGFPTYGGLAGYDLEAIAQGLLEVTDPDYLRYRVRSTQYVGDQLMRAGVPILQPTGGHAVYLDARAFLPHIPSLSYPGISLVNALYLLGGVRAVEVGTVMFGQSPDGSERAVDLELVRLAIPRRTYTQSHMDFVVEVVADAFAQRNTLCGLKMTHKPAVLRHFTARFEPLSGGAP